MPEVILPGTYIEVRAEGLISAGSVSTGNIGIVGTAAKGPVDRVTLVSSLSEAKEIFGESDEWSDVQQDKLTLIRALELVYKNGGRTVYAVRTANSDPESEHALSQASYILKNGNSTLLTLEATSPGSWGNEIEIKITPIAKSDESPSDRAKVELIYGIIQETYEIASTEDLVAKVNNNSVLVKGVEPVKSNLKKLPDQVEVKLQNGKDGVNATAADYGRGLALLENEIVNLVLLAGQGVTAEKRDMVAALEGHLKITAGIKRERICLIGSSFKDGKDDLDDIANHNLNNDRLIFVTPGVIVTDKGKQNRLPGAYLAAAVAGLISSLAIQASPTNKVLTIEGLTTEFNSSKLEKLVQSKVFAVEKRNGFRVVKGITTNDTAWKQITTRRIVDYAIYGVRSSCNPYIGKLNNARVRGAMKATLDGFLTRMVDNEALVSYQLEVSATRAQEVAGEAIVTMTLMPTFSIDFVKVTMYLS